MTRESEENNELPSHQYSTYGASRLPGEVNDGGVEGKTAPQRPRVPPGALPGGASHSDFTRPPHFRLPVILRRAYRGLSSGIVVGPELYLRSLRWSLPEHNFLSTPPSLSGGLNSNLTFFYYWNDRGRETETLPSSESSGRMCVPSFRRPTKWSSAAIGHLPT